MNELQDALEEGLGAFVGPNGCTYRELATLTKYVNHLAPILELARTKAQSVYYEYVRSDRGLEANSKSREAFIAAIRKGKGSDMSDHVKVRCPSCNRVWTVQRGESFAVCGACGLRMEVHDTPDPDMSYVSRITEEEFEELRKWIAGLIPDDAFAFGEQLVWSVGWKRIHSALFDDTEEIVDAIELGINREAMKVALSAFDEWVETHKTKLGALPPEQKAYLVEWFTKKRAT